MKQSGLRLRSVPVEPTPHQIDEAAKWHVSRENLHRTWLDFLYWDADLEAYLDSGEPLAVAGSFTLDGLGGWFVDRIDGDPSNVIGLSLPLTRVLLRRVGLSVAELWAANSVTS